MKALIKTITAILSALPILSAFPVRAQTTPTVDTVPSSAHPPIPSGLKVACSMNDGRPSKEWLINMCPALKLNGYMYWVYNFADDRNAMGIVAYDSSGKVVNRWDKPGAHSVRQINVSTADKTVDFLGEGSGKISMAWTELAVQSPPLDTWKLGKITNNTSQHVMFSFHVSSNSTVGADALDNLTMVGVLVYDQGILSIDPQRNTSGCKTPLWHTTIRFADQAWEFYYNTGTKLDITINPNKQLVLTPGPDGEILSQGQPPRCHQ